MASQPPQLPLEGTTVVELGHEVATAYAGRLLATLGADVVIVEPPEGSPLRRRPPFLEGAPEVSAVFAYLSAGKQSLVCDLDSDRGRIDFATLTAGADVLISDELDAPDGLAPDTIHVSVRPFGSFGPKAGWHASELNLIHASGEGFLLPNGLSAELFPDRPPLKVHGYFAEMQGGVMAALAAVSCLIARPAAGPQSADVAIQDAAVAVAAFGLQRFGDGSVEHRTTRSFKYGGVIECADGYVELLTLEERQWQGLVALMGSPDWALDERYADAVERGHDGDKINAHIRTWARSQHVGDLIARAQGFGVPMARYDSPAEVLTAPHGRSRGTFSHVPVPGVGDIDIVSSPFAFDGATPQLRSGPPEVDSARAWSLARSDDRGVAGTQASTAMESLA